MIESSDFLSDNTNSNTSMNKVTSNTYQGSRSVNSNFVKMELVGDNSSSSSYSFPTENNGTHSESPFDICTQKQPKGGLGSKESARDEAREVLSKQYENMNEPDFQVSLIGHKHNGSISEVSKELESSSSVQNLSQIGRACNVNNDIIYERTDESLMSSPQGVRNTFKSDPLEDSAHEKEKIVDRLVMTFHPQHDGMAENFVEPQHAKLGKPSETTLERHMKTPKFTRCKAQAVKDLDCDLFGSASLQGISKSSSIEQINSQISLCQDCGKLVLLNDYKAHREKCKVQKVSLTKFPGNLLSSHTRSESISSVSHGSQTKLGFSASITDLIAGLRQILDTCRESTRKEELCLLGFLIKLEDFMKVILTSHDLKELSGAIASVKSLVNLLAFEEASNKNYLETIGICQKCINLAQEKIEILEESSGDDLDTGSCELASFKPHARTCNISCISEQEVFNATERSSDDTLKVLASDSSSEKRRFYELAANIRKHLPADHKSKRLLIAQVYQRCKELSVPEKDWSGFVCSIFLSAE